MEFHLHCYNYISSWLVWHTETLYLSLELFCSKRCVCWTVTWRPVWFPAKFKVSQTPLQQLHTYLEALGCTEVCCYVICVFQSWKLEQIKVKQLILLKTLLCCQIRLFSHLTAWLLSDDITFLFGSVQPCLHFLFLCCQCVLIGTETV